MSAGFDVNSFIFTGTLITNPIKKTIQVEGSDTPRTYVRLLVSSTRRVKINGEVKIFKNVFPVKVTKQAESCMKALHRGSTVMVQGYLTSDTIEDAETHKKSTRLREVISENITFLSNVKKDRDQKQNTTNEEK